LSAISSCDAMTAKLRMIALTNIPLSEKTQRLSRNGDATREPANSQGMPSTKA